MDKRQTVPPKNCQFANPDFFCFQISSALGEKKNSMKKLLIPVFRIKKKVTAEGEQTGSMTGSQINVSTPLPVKLRLHSYESGANLIISKRTNSSFQADAAILHIYISIAALSVPAQRASICIELPSRTPRPLRDTSPCHL
jgi:hypothetical protein